MAYRIDVFWWCTLLGVLATVGLAGWGLPGGSEAAGAPAAAIASAMLALIGLVGLGWRQWRKTEVLRQVRQSWKQLELRERSFQERLALFQEWLEFPVARDLSDHAEATRRLRERVAADVRLETMLLEATQSIYEKLRTNQYAPHGVLNFDHVRRDAWELAERVARLYHPQSLSPLLEASPELLLRATQRTVLQLSVLLEQLPLDVKSRSVQELHAYLRRAVSAYGAYQSARPYLPWLSRAYYFGRFAMGGNPLTLGAWWLLGTLGAQGAQAAATRLFHRRAIEWLHSAVRVIGTEAAGIYGGDYRLRDPNWIYAAELTDLMSRLPPSGPNLQLALNEVGGLPLRCEYDRLFLYRCLAARASARPERFAASVMLSSKLRRHVALRLRQFCQGLSQPPAEILQAWRAAATERLHVQLRSVTSPSDAEHAHTAAEEAAQTLASFVLDVKNGEPEQLAQALAPTGIWSRLTAEQRQQWLRHWNEAPPYMFSFPSIAHDSPEATWLLDDIVHLASSIGPFDPEMENAAASLAAYLQHDPDAFLKRLGAGLVAQLARRTATPLPRATTPDAARAALNYLGDDRSALAMFHAPKLQADLGGTFIDRQLWLLADELGLILILVQDNGEPTALWAADWSEVRFTNSQQWLRTTCRLEGGRGLTPLEVQAITVPRPRLSDRTAWELLQQRLTPP